MLNQRDCPGIQPGTTALENVNCFPPLKLSLQPHDRPAFLKELIPHFSREMRNLTVWYIPQTGLFFTRLLSPNSHDPKQTIFIYIVHIHNRNHRVTQNLTNVGKDQNFLGFSMY